MSDPIVTYKPRVPYPQALGEKQANRRHSRDFKQVKVNLPLLVGNKTNPWLHEIP